MRRLVLARAAVAAVTVAGITAGLAPVTTAVAAEAPEPGLTIPAAVEGDPTAAVLQQAGETGYLTGTVKTGFHWTSYADKATEPVPVPAGYTTVYGTDSDVLAFVGDGRSVLLRDMRDGGERTFPVPAGESLRLVIGDAVVTEADGPKPTRWTVHTWQDGRISSRTVPVAGADSTDLLAWDRDGFYLTTTYGTLLDDWRYTDIHRVDVSGTTTRTRLADLPYDTASNGDTVSQWHEDGRLTVWNRKTTDLQKPVRELTVPYDKRASLLGTVGDHVLIARPLSAKEVTPYADLMWRVVAVPFDGGPERTLFERATAMPRYKADGTLLVGAATARGTGGETGPGVYTVRPGADGGLVTAKLLDAPPARGSVAGLSLAQGRLTTVDRVPLLDGPEALLRSTDLTVAGTPRAGVRTERGADAAQFPGGCLTAADCPETFATGDGRVVFRTKDGKGLGVIDAGGSLPARTVTTEQPIAATPDSLRVSGRYAAARSTDDRLRVYDVETGKNVRTETGGTPFALSGSTLWKQQGGTAEVRAVDVSTGRSAGTAALPADCRTPGLQAAGTFLYWRCATGESAVYDTASRTSVPLPAHTAALLSDGYVAWLKDGQLHTTDVRGTAGTRLIGTPKGGAPGRDWTVDRFGGPVAYVDADEAVRVVPAGAEAPGLAALDADVPPTAPGSWKPRWWVSKPAASWALTLTHKATGTVVRTLTGGEARGVVAADWDGKDADGKPVTNGAYTWTMTAEPADGAGPRLERRGALLVSGGLASAYGTYKPVTPTRLMDTRSGLGVPKAKVGPAGTVTLRVAGVGGVPATGVTAVVLNVTATGPTSAGFVSVYPSGTQRTSASNLNFTAGQTVPNLVVVPVVDGKVSFYNHAGSVDLLADVA
ncbi:FlgD immunoglobulin-like domain containing protein, partial [Streptomyces sp. NPDC054861]